VDKADAAGAGASCDLEQAASAIASEAIATAPDARKIGPRLATERA
jgi:hypothetical protein